RSGYEVRRRRPDKPRYLPLSSRRADRLVSQNAGRVSCMRLVCPAKSLSPYGSPIGGKPPAPRSCPKPACALRWHIPRKHCPLVLKRRPSSGALEAGQAPVPEPCFVASFRLLGLER